MGSYDHLKSELGEIVQLVESVPDRYRDRCFELLLTRLLSESGDAASAGQALSFHQQTSGRQESLPSPRRCGPSCSATRSPRTNCGH